MRLTAAINGFLPTPSARRATESRPRLYWDCQISTHALREEGDVVGFLLVLHPNNISTHALREEGDQVGR